MNERAKQEEFLSYYNEVNDRLVRFARAMTKCRYEAEDLVSETILQAFESFHKLRNKNSFNSYVFTIARRLFLRKLWRKRIFGIYDVYTAEQIPDSVNIEINHDIEILYDTLNRLPLKQKEAIILYEISGFSLEEITDIQGGTLSGVKSRLKRGRERLKQLMNEEPDCGFSNNFESQSNMNTQLLGDNLKKYPVEYVNQ